jgi:LPXTG-motif cell wall-anchored protein
LRLLNIQSVLLCHFIRKYLNEMGNEHLKALKHVSILLSFMLLFAVIFPAAGALAAGNGNPQAVKNEKVNASSKINVKESTKSTPLKTQNKQAVNSRKSDNASNVKKESAQVQQKDQKQVQQRKTEEKPAENAEQSSSSNGEEAKTKSATVTVKEEVNNNKSTQIHLHLNKCVNSPDRVFVELKGEWKEMTNPGGSPLFKLLDGGEFVKDEVTAFKLVFTGGEELIVPVSELKVGVEAEGTINYWLENCELPAEEETSPEKETNKNTQIHLHLKNCVPPAAEVLVEISGEWKAMSNPGKSPLYKLPDGGEVVKEDVTAFKFILKDGGELVVPVSDMKVGVEAEGTINYWLENCEMPAENAFKTISLKIDDSEGKIDSAVLVMMNGKRIEFKLVNMVWTIVLSEETTLEMVRGIELTSNGQTKLIPINSLSDMVQLEDGAVTIQVNWGIQGEFIGEDQNESASPAPVNNSGEGTPGGTSGSQAWYGDVLPQTGEGSRMMYYLLGLLVTAGGILLRFKNPLKN